MSTATVRMSPRDVLSYLFLAVSWGLSFLFVLKTVQAFGWVGAVAFRALVAAGVLAGAAKASGRRLDFSAGLLPTAIVGATTVTGQLLGLAFATPRIGTAMTAIVVGAIPLFSMVMSQVSGIERMTRQGLAGLVLGFCGIVLLVGFPVVPFTWSFALGCAGALTGAVSAAFGSNYASQHLRRAGTWEVSIGSFLSGGTLALPFLLAVPVPATPRAIDFFYVALLGCVTSALAYLLYFRLVSRIGATRAISVEFGVTFVAVLAGVMLLGERLSGPQIAGGCGIVAGCLLVLGLVPGRKARHAINP